jgi:endonuclease/exonuclease/phosphatase family metal-dependent hydrolase
LETENKNIKNAQSRLGLVNRIVMLCNHFAVVALLISYLSPFIRPENFWIFAFFGLGYPILVFINILFALYWFIQLKPKGFYSLLIILCGWFILHRFVQIDGSPSEKVKQKKLKVMSWNVKVFDLYNWTHNKETRELIMGLISSEQPDIACFQEFFHRDSSEFSNTDSLKKLNNWNYSHVEYTKTVKKIHHWGVATFSRYPIINGGKVDFGYEGNNICMFTDIKVGDDTLRLYNMHLQSIAFSKADYKFAEDIQKDVETEELEHSKNIMRRLKKAFIKRSHQADLIAKSIAESPYPVIVCGDFNDTPSSYTYSTISKNLKDAFIESGFGLGKSYNGAFPSFRIDYILFDKEFSSYDFRTMRENLSDHFPIVTALSLN